VTTKGEVMFNRTFARASNEGLRRRMRQERTQERKIALQRRWYVGGLAAVVASSLVFSGMSPATAEEVTPTDPAATSEATTTDTAATDAGTLPPAEETVAEEPAEAPAVEEPAVEEPAVEEPAAPAEEPQAEEPAAPVAALAAPAEEDVVALACPPLFYGFEIDGDRPVNCGGQDWDSVPDASTNSHGPYKTTNDDSDPSTWYAAGSPSQHATILNAQAWSTTVGGDPILFAAWDRASGTGSSGFIIEITKAPTRSGGEGNVPQPDRSLGGTVFFLDQSGNDGTILRGVCTYTDTASYPGTCVTSDFPANSFMGVTNADGTFVEVGLNLALLANVKPGCPPTLGSAVYIRSFTGNNNELGGNIQAWAGPLTVTPPSTCVPLTATKTAVPSFVRDYNWEIEKSVDPASATVRPGENATFDYVVTVTPSGPIDSGFTVTGVITVTNTNPIAVPITGVTDSIPGAECTITTPQLPTVPAGGTADIAYSCTLPSGSAGTNSATVTWNSSAIPAGSAQATADFTFAGVAPSTTTDASVTVSDTAAEFDGPKTVTDVTKPTVFNYSRTLGEDVAAGACKEYDNTASIAATVTQPELSDSATVEVCTGEDLTIEKNVVVSLTRTYAWDIAKSVDETVRTVDENGQATFEYTVEVTPGAATDSDWAMEGEIDVTNPNSRDVTATVTDVPSFDGASCTVTGGVDATIPANSTKTFDYTCSFSEDGPFITGSNKAAVTWDADEAASPGSSAEYTAPITEADWDKTLVNDTITVIDDMTDPENPVELGTANWADGPTEFTYELTLDGTPGTCVDYTNTAWIEETGEQADETVTVCDYQDLIVSKTAAGSFDRDYDWSITKTVDHTSATVGAGASAVFAYAVTVTPTVAMDSNFAVSGSISVTNPNDVDVAITLEDALPGGECEVTGTDDLVIPAGASVEFPYECILADATVETAATNTVGIAWDAEELLGTSGAAQATADVDFADVTPTTTDASATVSDTAVEFGGEVVLNAVDGEKVFTYSRDLSTVDGACATHPNTATVTPSNDEPASASQSVEVCPAAQPPLPATGGGEMPPLLVIMGLFALLGGTTMLIVARRRRGEVKATI
jgi:LPXTG-motif cell wall-anchored protein